MAPDVLDACGEAAGAFVDMARAAVAGQRRHRAHTGAQAGIVTSGAAAAITLAAAACLARLDIARMKRLPDTEGMPIEVIMFRAHRTGYDHAIRAAGARIVEVGFNDIAAGSGVRGLEGWEIEAAIGPKTVAIAYAANPTGQPSLPAVAAVARKHDLPVIVDGRCSIAAQSQPHALPLRGRHARRLQRRQAIRGPQGTGILCGEKELVVSALIQQLDMDI